MSTMKFDIRRSLALALALAGLLSMASCGGGSRTAPPPKPPEPTVPPEPPEPPEPPVPTVPPIDPNLPLGAAITCNLEAADCNLPPEPPAPPPPSGTLPTADDFAAHPEYSGGEVPEGFANWALAAVNAADAYARIVEQTQSVTAPGDGVTVGVIDTGIDLGHWEFDPARVTEASAGTAYEDGSLFSHGTAVASVVAARRDPNNVPDNLRGFNFHGIAWGVRLKMFPIRLGRGGSAPYTPVDLSLLDDSGSSILYRTALSEGLDMLSLSFGVKGLIEQYGEPALRTHLRDTIAVLAQQGKAEKTLIVRSAGNAHGAECTPGSAAACVGGRVDATSPGVMAGLPLRIEELRPHMVAVVATQRNGMLANFSNRCGIAAKWCIAAPGHRIRAAYFGPDPTTDEPGVRGYMRTSGTSFSAPYVAGGLAVMKHYFRNQMRNSDLLTRLYRTATVTPDPVAPGGQCPAHLDTDGDRSRCELSSTHGWGLMNLDAATRPQGVMSVALDNSLSGRRVASSSTFIRGGPALGNALATALRGSKLAVFDDLDAPFWIGLDGLWEAAAPAGIQARLSRFLAPRAESHWRDGVRTVAAPGVAAGLVELPWGAKRLRLGLNHAGGEQERFSGHAGLFPMSDGGLSLTVDSGAFQASAFTAGSGFGRTEAAARGFATGVVTDWRPAESPLGVRFGFLRESDSALGTTASGAFGDLAAGVTFGGIGFSTHVGRWRLSADGEVGVTRPETRRGLVRGISRIFTSAFSLAVERPLEDGGRFQLSLSQPLRVERGRARFNIPTGRTLAGAVTRDTVAASLSPSGRQTDLAGEWSLPVTGGGEVRLRTTLSFEPGHETSRAPEIMLLTGYRLSF